MFITRICMWWGEVFSLTGWSVRGEVFVKSTSWVTVPMAPLNNYFVVHVKKTWYYIYEYMTVLGSLHFNTLRVRIYLTLVYYSGRCVYDPLTIEILTNLKGFASAGPLWQRKNATECIHVYINQCQCINRKLDPTPSSILPPYMQCKTYATHPPPHPWCRVVWANVTTARIKQFFMRDQIAFSGKRPMLIFF